ncbi:hypothetical protein [uncultured Parolsenella sp.]|uniref:hypothetical protein n=1 Tax=uncultured Parolsenella sp. TaxID=2083008 RepID=UPI0025F7FBD2|nr:hypothetical protein [uncultured Parolsenella sp.]
MGEEVLWYHDIPAPVDNDGNVVPLATKSLVNENGEELEVSSIEYRPTVGLWFVTFMRQMYSTPLSRCAIPDSWERLLRDLDDMTDGERAYWNLEVEDLACDVARRVRALRRAERDGD